MDGISALVSCLCPLSCEVTVRKWPSHAEGRRSSPAPDLVPWSWTSASRTVRNELRFFISHAICGTLSQQPEPVKTRPEAFMRTSGTRTF